MDISLGIIAELYKVGQEYSKLTSDKNAASLSYCETATKVLDRLEKEVESYEKKVIGLWVVLGYISDNYPYLIPGPATTELCHKLFRQCARTVLNIKWQNLPEDTPCKKNFQATLQAFDNLMTQNGYTRFSLILSLIDTSWTHPVLSRLMASDEDEEDDEEGEQYIRGEDPVVLKLRVEMMLQENCEEFALNLCGWCLKHPALQNDLDIRQTQLMLLHKLNFTDKLQEECQKIPCHDGVRLVKRLQQAESNGPLCTVLAQTFLIQDWIRLASTRCCTKDLLKLWIQHQSQVDQDEEKFLSSIWAVAKLSSSTEQIGMLIESLRQERGSDLAQLYTDLFNFALNLDKTELEKLNKEGDQDALRELQMIVSGTCRKLAEIFADFNTKTAKACYLTAFSLHPSQMLLNAVERCWSSNHVSIFPECQTQDLEHINDTTSRDRGIVNIASLYEVERLLSLLRPCYLNPESSWDMLRTVCEKYLFEKQALAKQRALQSSTPSSEDTDLDSSSILETSSQDSQDSGETALTEALSDTAASVSPDSASQLASVGDPSSLSSHSSPASGLQGGASESSSILSGTASTIPGVASGDLSPQQLQGLMVQGSLPSAEEDFQLPFTAVPGRVENVPVKSSYSSILPSSGNIHGFGVSQQRAPDYSLASSSGSTATATATALVQGLASMTVHSGAGRNAEVSSLVGEDVLRLAQETVAGLPTGSQVFIASTQVKQQVIIALTPSSDGNFFLPDTNGSLGFTPRVQVSNNPVGIFPNVSSLPPAVSRRPVLKTRPLATMAKSGKPMVPKVSRPLTATISKAPCQAAVSAVASTQVSARLPCQVGGPTVASTHTPARLPCQAAVSTVASSHLPGRLPCHMAVSTAALMHVPARLPSQASVSTVASTHLSTRLPSQDGGSLVLVNPVNPNALPVMSSQAGLPSPDGLPFLPLGNASGQAASHVSPAKQPSSTGGNKSKELNVSKWSELGNEVELSQDAILESLHPGLRLEGGLLTEVDRSQPKKRPKKKKPPTVPSGSPNVQLMPNQQVLQLNASSSPVLKKPQLMKKPAISYAGALTLPHASQALDSSALSPLSPTGSSGPSSSPEGTSTSGASQSHPGHVGSDEGILRLPDGRFKRYNKNYFRTHYKCIICGILHNSFDSLRKHVKDACRARNRRSKEFGYDMKEVIRGLRVIQCNTCQAMCATDKDVRYHQENCVANRPKKTVKGDQVPASSPPSKKAGGSCLQQLASTSPVCAVSGGIPSVGIPSVGIPSVGIPSVGIPSVGIPSVGIPSAGTLSAGIPSAGTLSAGIPSTGIPSTGIPSAGIPSVGIPSAGTLSGGVPSGGTPSAGASSLNIGNVATSVPNVMPALGASVLMGNQILSCRTPTCSVSGGTFPMASEAVKPVGSGSLPAFSSQAVPVSHQMAPTLCSVLPVRSETLPPGRQLSTVQNQDLPRRSEGLLPQSEALPVTAPALPHRDQALPIGKEAASCRSESLTVGSNAISAQSDPVSTSISSAAQNLQALYHSLYSRMQSGCPSSEAYNPWSWNKPAPTPQPPEVSIPLPASFNPCTSSAAEKLKSSLLAHARMPAIPHQAGFANNIHAGAVGEDRRVNQHDLSKFSEQNADAVQQSFASCNPDARNSAAAAAADKKVSVDGAEKKKVAKKRVRKKEKDEAKGVGSKDGKEGGAAKKKSELSSMQMYELLKSSVGTCFYKCKLCSVSFSSLENFVDHWEHCLQKNPPSKKAVKRRHSSGSHSRKSKDLGKDKSEVPADSQKSLSSPQTDSTGSGELSPAYVPGAQAPGHEPSGTSADDSFGSEDSERTSSGKKKKSQRRVCDKCKLVFNDLPSYVKHLSSRHLTTYHFKNTGNRFKFTCALCSGNYATFFALMNHMPSHADQILREMSEKMADGTVLDYAPEKHEKLKLKAQRRADRLRKVREEAQRRNSPDDSRRRKSSSSNKDSALSDGAPSNTRNKVSKPSEAQDDPKTDHASSRKEECIRNKLVTHDVRVLLSDINFPGSEFSKELESYNSIASHTGRDLAKEKLELEDKPPTEDEEFERPGDQDRDGSAEDSEMTDVLGEIGDSSATSNDNEAKDLDQDEQPMKGEECDSDVISLLSEISSGSPSEDQFVLDCQEKAEFFSEQECPLEETEKDPVAVAEVEPTDNVAQGSGGDASENKHENEVEEAENVEEMVAAIIDDHINEVVSALLSYMESASQQSATFLEQEQPSCGSETPEKSAEPDSLMAAHSSESLEEGKSESFSEIENIAGSEEDCLERDSSEDSDAEEVPSDTATLTEMEVLEGQASSCCTQDNSNHHEEEKAAESKAESATGDLQTEASEEEEQTPAGEVDCGSVVRQEQETQDCEETAEACEIPDEQMPEVQDNFSGEETAECPESDKANESIDSLETLESHTSVENPPLEDVEMCQNEECKETDAVDVLLDSSTVSENQETGVTSSEASATVLASAADVCFENLEHIQTESTVAESGTGEEESSNCCHPEETEPEEVKEGSENASEGTMEVDADSLQCRNSIKEESVEEPLVPPVPVKRGRGRPRKRPLNTSENSVERPQSPQAKQPKTEPVEEEGTTSVKTRLKKAEQGQALSQMWFAALRDATSFMPKPQKRSTDPCLRDTPVATPKRVKRESPLRKPTIGTRSRRPLQFNRNFKSPPAQKEAGGGKSGKLSPQKGFRQGSQKRLPQGPQKNYPRRACSALSPKPGSSRGRSSRTATRPASPSPAKKPRGRVRSKDQAEEADSAGRVSSSDRALASPKTGKNAEAGPRVRGRSAPTPCTRISRSRSNSGASSTRASLQKSEPSAEKPQEGSLSPPSTSAPPASATGQQKSSSRGGQRRHSVEKMSTVSTMTPPSPKKASDEAAPNSFLSSYMNYLNSYKAAPGETKKKVDEQPSPEADAKLEGVKVLRDSVKTEPFCWDEEEEIDAAKADKEPIKALREQVSIAPFTWDLDENETSLSPPRGRRRLRARNKVNVRVDGKDNAEGSSSTPSYECEGVLKSVVLKMAVDDSHVDRQTPPLAVVVEDAPSEDGKRATPVTNQECTDSADVQKAERGISSEDEPHQRQCNKSEKPTVDTEEKPSTVTKPQAERPEATSRERFIKGRQLRSSSRNCVPCKMDPISLPAVVRKPLASPSSARSGNIREGQLVPRIQVYRVDPVKCENELKSRNPHGHPSDLSARTVHTPVPIDQIKSHAASSGAAKAASGSTDSKSWTIAKRTKTGYPFSYTRARGQKKSSV